MAQALAPQDRKPAVRKPQAIKKTKNGARFEVVSDLDADIFAVYDNVENMTYEFPEWESFMSYDDAMAFSMEEALALSQKQFKELAPEELTVALKECQKSFIETMRVTTQFLRAKQAWVERVAGATVGELRPSDNS